MGAALFCGHSDNLFSTPLYNSGARGGLTLGRFVRPSVRPSTTPPFNWPGTLEGRKRLLSPGKKRASGV